MERILLRLWAGDDGRIVEQGGATHTPVGTYSRTLEIDAEQNASLVEEINFERSRFRITSALNLTRDGALVTVAAEGARGRAWRRFNVLLDKLDASQVLTSAETMDMLRILGHYVKQQVVGSAAVKLSDGGKASSATTRSMSVETSTVEGVTPRQARRLLEAGNDFSMSEQVEQPEREQA